MSCNCRRCREKAQREEVITSPTKTVVNTRTKERVVKHIHPTEVINVNRTVVRNEHFFPVHEREVNEVVEENFNCGSDFNNNRCRPFWNW
ncbi:CotD family spore coat protein [Peribacillus loiseleuriae]|uniref:Spore coat protein D n=1 Tax=Peribacillus loiseleuriae TaxID=1679170 RepID=A0A0K9GTM4_9BACI|nr:CotD family spore coat protein [Peribacillus loiseleuriae]KMY49622.1 hypothetical protein AC625_08775 [Peribacillus loiseleuriae]